MSYYNNIKTLDEIRNNPRLLLKADLVIIAAGRNCATVMTLVGHTNDPRPFTGIHIAHIPSVAFANKAKINQGDGEYVYNEDDEEVFHYAGNMYVYDVEGAVETQAIFDVEDDPHGFGMQFHTMGINPDVIFQMIQNVS